MDESVRGAVLVDETVEVDDRLLTGLARAIGSGSAVATSRLVPFFGPTVGGESVVVEGIGLDLSRALLGGLSYEWHRPFEEGETVAVRVTVDDVFERGSNQFGVIVAEFFDSADELVQRQTATFIERGAK